MAKQQYSSRRADFSIFDRPIFREKWEYSRRRLMLAKLNQRAGIDGLLKLSKARRH
jgi:hypothetical protein